ncbi:hypothetical protein O181_071853 [Austropuccinia psidii MF-1]|uniref:Uncharacterized protein n=1 Tax=Austropuccinia psidii MF-1 TaxID=1389203 RepID=A0A9Q3F6B0_9BASI|nr:hypothetical protein [Austropuccinia psidii MF-1]
MGNFIRENYDDDQKLMEENLVEYQEESQLEEGLPQDTTNHNLCKHNQDSQKFLATPNKGMEYINFTTSKIKFCVDNSQHPLILYSGAHCSIIANNYLDIHFSNWETQLFPTKGKNFRSASVKMNSIGTIVWVSLCSSFKTINTS